MSIPSFGFIYAVGIIVETGQIKHFKDETKSEKYTGPYWPKKHSGNL
jgi:hypothetical protein